MKMLLLLKKLNSCEGLCDRYIFQEIAIESSGVLGRDTDAFISRLGHLTTSICFLLEQETLSALLQSTQL